MKYKLLGKSGLRVSELALGTMTFGEEWGWGSSKAESKKVFDTYANAGGNFIDTANHYTRLLPYPINGSLRWCTPYFTGNFYHFFSDS